MAEKKVSIDEVQPGMELSRALCDEQGRLIIPEGGRLNPMAIKRFPRWNITHVFIKIEEEGSEGEDEANGENEAGESSETDSVFISRVEFGAEERFGSLSSNKFNDDLKKITVKNLIEKGKGVVPGL